MFRSILEPLASHLRRFTNLPEYAHVWKALRTIKYAHGLVSVCYVTKRFPNRPPMRTEHAVGGTVKLTYLAEVFPHHFPECNILYCVSSTFHPQMLEIIDAAKRKGIKIVVNQNGVYYTGWFPGNWQQENARLATLRLQADYVIYQSEFCLQAAELFLGESRRPQTILYNPVDLDHYKMHTRPFDRDNLRLLTIARVGYQFHRIETAIRTLALVQKRLPGASLRLPGYDFSDRLHRGTVQQIRDLCTDLRLKANSVVCLPTYNREQAPSVLSDGDILLHTKYNDPSPNLVVEALACGLPVVYSASGGTPELVGLNAGVGLNADLTWDHEITPEPTALAAAILHIADHYTSYSRAARERAEAKFSLENYVMRHKSIFERILS